MTDKADLIQAFAEALDAAEASTGVEGEFLKASQELAVTLGDTLFTAGMAVTLDSGVEYTCAPAFWYVNFLGLPVSGSAAEGQVLLRDGKALEDISELVPDAEAARRLDRDATGLSESKPAEADLEERKAMIAELPELLEKTLAALKARRDPSLTAGVALARDVTRFVAKAVEQRGIA